MWWNFVGRSHDDIVGYRRQWEEHDDRFGSVAGYPGSRLPAPPLPNATLLPVRNRRPRGTDEPMTTDKTGAQTTVTERARPLHHRRRRRRTSVWPTSSTATDDAPSRTPRWTRTFRGADWPRSSSPRR